MDYSVFIFDKKISITMDMLFSTNSTNKRKNEKGNDNVGVAWHWKREEEQHSVSGLILKLYT